MASETETSGFARHLRACNNAVLPGDRLPFLIGTTPVGWVKPAFAAALAVRPEIAWDGTRIVLRNAAALQDIAHGLATKGSYPWRNEAFDVRATPDGPVLAQIDRGALPSFGLFAAGVHVNGLVRRPDGLHIWVARRAPDRFLDPNKLDHLTAGGIPAGLTPEQTLIKEAQEEAAIPADLARQAWRTGIITYAMERPEGLRRDMLYCYDLELPENFQPRSTDGEVASFELWPAARVLQTVRDTDMFKFNVNLVLIDLFVREGLLPPPAIEGWSPAAGDAPAIPSPPTPSR